jgi:hypothetical protein
VNPLKSKRLAAALPASEPLRIERVEDHSLNSPDNTKFQKNQPKRGGRASREKGNRLERAVVHLLQDAGFGAERVPLSGSVGGSYKGDISIPLLGHDLTVECKARASGFASLYDWLEGRDALVIKANRKDALVVLRIGLAAEIAAAAERGKSNSKFPEDFVPRESGCPGCRQDSQSPATRPKLNIET